MRCDFHENNKRCRNNAVIAWRLCWLKGDENVKTLTSFMRCRKHAGKEPALVGVYPSVE